MDNRIGYEYHESERGQGGDDVEESEAEEDLNDFEEQEIRMVDEEADEYEEIFTWKAIVELQCQRSDDEHGQEAIAVAGLVVYGLGEANRLRAEHRHECQLYLVWDDLLENPWEGTLWQALNSSKNDWAFITTILCLSSIAGVVGTGLEIR
jgi:hypothetical protein